MHFAEPMFIIVWVCYLLFFEFRSLFSSFLVSIQFLETINKQTSCLLHSVVNGDIQKHTNQKLRNITLMSSSSANGSGCQQCLSYVQQQASPNMHHRQQPFASSHSSWPGSFVDSWSPLQNPFTPSAIDSATDMATNVIT